MPAVIISDSVFTGNYGADFGGAIYMESVGLELRDVLLDSNACAPVRGLGGGLASAPLIPGSASAAAARILRRRLPACAGPSMPGLPGPPFDSQNLGAVSSISCKRQANRVANCQRIANAALPVRRRQCFPGCQQRHGSRQRRRVHGRRPAPAEHAASAARRAAKRHHRHQQHMRLRGRVCSLRRYVAYPPLTN